MYSLLDYIKPSICGFCIVPCLMGIIIQNFPQMYFHIICVTRLYNIYTYNIIWKCVCVVCIFLPKNTVWRFVFQLFIVFKMKYLKSSIMQYTPQCVCVHLHTLTYKIRAFQGNIFCFSTCWFFMYVHMRVFVCIQCA